MNHSLGNARIPNCDPLHSISIHIHIHHQLSSLLAEAACCACAAFAHALYFYINARRIAFALSPPLLFLCPAPFSFRSSLAIVSSIGISFIYYIYKVQYASSSERPGILILGNTEYSMAVPPMCYSQSSSTHVKYSSSRDVLCTYICNSKIFSLVSYA